MKDNDWFFGVARWFAALMPAIIILFVGWAFWFMGSHWLEAMEKAAR